jgi:hypothetical protein
MGPKRMREILENLDILREPKLNLQDLSLDGVLFGSGASNFPREKVVDVTLSPIVANYRGGTNLTPQFFDVAGDPLALEAVIESVIRGDGILHFAGKVSFKIAGGTVVGFALYGDPLSYFDKLGTYPHFCTAFGPADRIVVNEAHNDLLGYDHFYYGARKRVVWDEFSSRVSLINLGQYEGNDGATPDSDAG